MSPFTFPNSPGRIFTGSKYTSLLTIDLRTGHQIDCFSSLTNHSTSDEECVCEDSDMLDDLENKGRANRDVLFVGRTDYRLTIHSPHNDMFSPKSPSASLAAGGKRNAGAQEIVYSTYTPNSFDRPLAEYWASVGSSQEAFESDGTETKRTRVELGHDGVAVGVHQDGGVKWVTKLGIAGIAVYDLLLPLTPHANPILVPQPPPHLPSLFPVTEQSHEYDIHAKPPTTYIGSVSPALTIQAPPQSNKSTQPPTSHDNPEQINTQPLLYALSSVSYPLINFAPPPRPGSFANGSFLLSQDIPERDQLLPKLLDPPKDPAVPDPNEISKERIQPREKSKRSLWWPAGAVLGLIICGLSFAGIYRTKSVPQALTPPINEKTPLIDIGKEPAVKAKSVTIVEPESAVVVKAGDVSSETTPKKRTARRRVRGKKKRDDSAADSVSGDDPDVDGSMSDKDRDGKPLPDLPRELSTTALADRLDKEKLAISETVIGWGSHGTVVLKGTWGGRPVAVKRLLSDFTRLASQEVKLLQASDDHPNVIRCESSPDIGCVHNDEADIRLLSRTAGQFPLHRPGSMPGLTCRSHRISR